MFKKIALIALLYIPTISFADESKQKTTSISALQGLSLGLGVVSNSGIYIGEKTEVTPIPIIGYETDRFFIRGLYAGTPIHKNKMFTVNAIASVNMMDLDVADLSTSKLAFKNISKLQLEDRDRSIDVGLESLVGTPYGLFSFQVVNDVGGASKAAELRLNYQYFWRVNPKLNIMPNVGMEWLSDKRANYYYGILDAEVARGVASYQPDAVLIPHASLGGSYALNEQVRLSGTVMQKFFPDKVKDGPLIDKSSTLNAYMALTYKF